MTTQPLGTKPVAPSNEWLDVDGWACIPGCLDDVCRMSGTCSWPPPEIATEISRDINGYYPWEVPQPGEPQCAADGVRNGPDGPGGTEHYWTCTAPGTVDVDGELLCAGHAEEYGCNPAEAGASSG